MNSAMIGYNYEMKQRTIVRLGRSSLIGELVAA
jgi:hypothetical protein